MLIVAKGLFCATGALILLAVMVLVALGLLADDRPMGWALIVGYIALPIAPVAVVVFGLPAHLGLRWLGGRSLRAYVWTGFILAAVVSFAIGIKLPDGARLAVALFEIAFILPSGPIAAAVFWYTARPDRTNQSLTT